MSRLMMMLVIISRRRRNCCKGDPLSPISFNIVANMLAILICGSQEDSRVGGGGGVDPTSYGCGCLYPTICQ